MENAKLGFGIMTLPRMNAADDGSMGMLELNRMVDLFLKSGYTYFDASYAYQGMQGEKAAAECLVKRHPREWFSLASKLHYSAFDSADDVEKVFNEQRKNAEVEIFDHYMLHDIDEKSCEKYKKYRCFEWMQKKRSEGLIKHAGISFTGDAAFLDRLLNEYPRMGFVQIRMNSLEAQNREKAMDIFECAAAHSVPVIVTSDDTDVIRYAMGFPEVMYAVAGIKSMKMLKELKED